MAIHPLVCADAGLAASQNVQVVEFFLQGATVGTNGVKLALLANQSSASNRVHLAIGNGDCSDAKPTAAAVEALIKRPNGNSLSAQEELIKTGLKTFLDEIEPAADGAECIAFAVGGLNVSEIVAAEFVVSTGTVEQSMLLVQAAAAVRIPEPVTLAAGNKLAKAGGTGVDLDTDKVILVGGLNNGSSCTVAGCFTLPEADRLAQAASIVKLRLYVKN